MKTPEVSVVMPAFNAAEFLDDAVASILNQTFRDFEFIIIDDGSTDETPDILRKYAEADDRVRVYRQGNQGVIAALNRGCQIARGQFVARMDADDISLPRRFERQTNFLKKHPEIGIVGTWAANIDKNNSVVGKWCLPPSPMVLKWNHFFRVCVIHPTVLMRRPILEKLNFYRSDSLYADDWDLWLRASAMTEFGNTPEILFKYRVWSKSVSKSHSQECQKAPIKLLVPFMRDFLGSDLSVEAVTVLKLGKCENLQQILSGATLLESLYRKFMRVNPVNAEDCCNISIDAAKRMGRLALQASRFSKVESLLLIKRALHLNHRVLSPSAILKAFDEHRRFLKSREMKTPQHQSTT